MIHYTTAVAVSVRRHCLSLESTPQNVYCWKILRVLQELWMTQMQSDAGCSQI
jgi:hypothetical protein